MCSIKDPSGVHGCSVYTTRVHGPWSRVVCTPQSQKAVCPQSASLAWKWKLVVSSVCKWALPKTVDRTDRDVVWVDDSDGKEKERKSIYIAPFRIKVHTKRSGMDHTILPANNTMPAFPSFLFINKSIISWKWYKMETPIIWCHRQWRWVTWWSLLLELFENINPVPSTSENITPISQDMFTRESESMHGL